MGKDILASASHLCFLGDESCEYMWKRGPSSASFLSQEHSYYALLTMLSPPSPNRDWMWGMGMGYLGERDLYPLELGEETTLGVRSSYSFIPLNSSSVLKEKNCLLSLLTLPQWILVGFWQLWESMAFLWARTLPTYPSEINKTAFCSLFVYGVCFKFH